MIGLSESELAVLGRVAFEMREDLAFRGVNVTSAMQLDSCFESGQARAGLRRDILKQACRRAASHGAVHCRPVGEGLELVMACEDGVLRRFRLRSARRDGSGAWVIPANSQSSLVPHEDDVDLLMREEIWVLGVLLASDVELAEVFAARVVDVLEGKPGKLVLAADYPLLTPAGPPDDFTPSDEDLDLFDDESDAAGGESAA